MLIMPMALAALAGGCGRLVTPTMAGVHDLCGPALTLPAAASSLSGRALLANAGLDLTGPEARVAVIGVFVTSPGGGAAIIGSGSGEGLAFSYRPKGGGNSEGDIYLEWGLERSSHEESGSGIPAEYLRATAGVRYSLAWGTRSEVFFSFGGGYHGIEVSGGAGVDGPGAYGGVGIEFLLGRACSALLNARFNYFWGDDPGYAATLVAGIGLRL
jgi:hypothetical protein